MKKILISLVTLGLVGGLGFAATKAYFSDVETSTGNTFTAGSLDLKVSNESYATNPLTGVFEASPNTSWASDDLSYGTVVHKFFDFIDVKPGDVGEDTIDLTVKDNPAWACAKLDLTSNADVTCTEPELADDQTCAVGDLSNGDLAQGIEFIWWADDGDNVLELNEEATKYYLGPDSIKNLLGPNGTLDLTLADSQLNFFNPGATPAPLAGNKIYYIGKGWCFGQMTLNPAVEGTSNPIVRGTTGFTCEGKSTNNAAQSDSLTADLTFTVEQSRNNPAFLCPEHMPIPTQ